jgi:uncharacterized protein (UPF0297 family)
MKNDETTVVDTDSIINKNTKKTLLEICEDLEERGYNPTKQIVAYLISGDPGYISSYKECRNRILEFKREDILELMLVDFIKEK